MVESISPAALEARLPVGDSPDDLLVVDTRSPESHADGHVPGALNYPFAVDGDLDVEAFRQATGADRSTPIVTVCGGGRSSTALAEALAAEGFDAAVLDGGMRAWRAAGGPVAVVD